MSKSKAIRILYKNWRDETAERKIEPIKIWFGSTEWHKEEQWIMTAVDLDRNVEREFALKDILKWLD
ncbi:MAG: hypothetical protein WCQ49_01390 [Candidatus Saccharibacteria bacterium]